MKTYYRKNVAYEVSRNRKMIHMMKCGECHRMFKVANGKPSVILYTDLCTPVRHLLDHLTPGNCPHCGNGYDKTNTTAVRNARDEKHFFHNISTCVFDDVEDGKFTLSMVMIMRRKESVFTNRENPYVPNVGETAVNFRIRYDLNKKTAVAYLNHLRTEKDGLDHAKAFFGTWPRFRNVSIPMGKTFRELDISIHPEIVKQFCERIGVECPNVNETVTWYELQWMSKTRLSLSETRPVMFIGMKLKRNLWNCKNQVPLIESSIESYEEEIASYQKLLKLTTDPHYLKVYKKAILMNTDELAVQRRGLIEASARLKEFNRVYGQLKRFLRLGVKPKGFNETLFNTLTKAFEVSHTNIPAAFIPDYLKNPMAIPFAEYHNAFTNKDVRRNLIQDMGKVSYETVEGRESFIHQGIYRTNSFPPGNNAEELREVMISALASENTSSKNIDSRMYKKLVYNHQYYLLYDTVIAILQIRQAGESVKTKGNIIELHDMTSYIKRNLQLSDKPFALVENEPLRVFITKEDKYVFKYAENEKELGLIGREMNICVASYGNRCHSNKTRIVSVTRNNRLEGCLEILVPKNETTPLLVQAKSHSNKRISRKTQHAIKDFCITEKILIKTSDIQDDIVQETGEIIQKTLGLNNTVSNVSLERKDGTTLTPAERFMFYRNPSVLSQVADQQKSLHHSIRERNGQRGGFAQ